MDLGKIILATNNRHKLDEIREILSGKVKIVSLSDAGINHSVSEDGSTFEENAIKKAKEIMKIANMPVLADDSGLVVKALGGRPGVYSARYACDDFDDLNTNASDSDNNFKLLREMEGIDDRSAKYVCILAFSVPGKECKIFTGECCGTILNKMQGSSGFGYDPLFYIKKYDKTMAQLNLSEKNSVSHRRLALEKFLSFVSSNYLG